MASESWECSNFQEIDNSLLMEILQEYSCSEEAQEDPKVSGAMCSLEMEINHGLDDCEDCRLDDIFANLERYDCSRSMSFAGLEEAFDWVEMDVVAEQTERDLAEWYMDDCLGESVEMFGYEEYPGDYPSFYYGDCSSEQVYSSLWE
ncbi:hypothetical protein IHE45_04G051200 [Dioscorea alata]|uniref:Uncharacterized protein n=1 Tax=Dioscorea alata TaxID=55571 RepID=A0ACB7WCB6_DIOAL|nr:hypothetical protein IHE45_04G051200 [Dioscorea alata]